MNPLQTETMSFLFFSLVIISTFLF